jgi:hypothetical protein
MGPLKIMDIARHKSAILLATEAAPAATVRLEQEHHDND